jgi:polysaccharide deacetylase 2 family uncharacterized protein YibQ
VTDDLSAPLGQNRAVKRLGALPLIVRLGLAGMLGLAIAIFAGWAMLADDPLGGEPMVVVTANLGDNTGTKTAADADRPGPADSATDPAQHSATSPPGSKTITIIDGTNGKRQDVVVPASGDGRTGDGKLAALDARVSEPSRHGLLPKVAQDGARPSEVFAQPVKPLIGKPNAPRIAIVLGGLGIGAGITSDAIRKLPGGVTLAFGAYGGDLERQVARARTGGHEVLLQVPMEPADYPDNDPGPQTLLTTLDAGQNADRLHWLMSRFQGYVGIASLMGARFTASETALAPVLRETAKRGLIYVDDGTSPRSLASQIAGANNIAFVKADITLDVVPAPDDVDRALARLETVARERGIAIGMASAVPVSIERIARWAKAAAGRGILLIPITAAVAKAKSS